MESILEVKDLKVKYPGFCLDNISFSCQKGKIIGIIGTNGAGKSTTIKAIMHIIEREQGDIFWKGKTLTPKIISNFRENVGYVGENDCYYPNIKIRKILKMMSELYSNWDNETMEKYINIFQLDIGKKVKELSTGMRVKLDLLMAMSHNAEIYILDEPTSGLDPVIRKELLEILEHLAKDEEKTVIISSHITSDLEKIADRIIYIVSGKIELDDIKPSSRKYPYIDFRPAREIGNEVLTVENLSKTIDGEKILDNISFVLNREDKVALVGPNEKAKTVLFKILAGEMEPDSGSYKWGLTTTQSYFPKDNTKDFSGDETIVDWLTGYSEIKDATYVRGFLGRMLFAGEDGVKKVNVLSGGEKVRCMLSKLMISGANVLILDEPTDHLDMESITALNTGLVKFKGVLIFSSRDHQVVQTTANRIMEIINGSLIDKITTYDEYLESDEMARKRFTYTVSADEESDD